MKGVFNSSGLASALPSSIQDWTRCVFLLLFTSWTETLFDSEGNITRVELSTTLAVEEKQIKDKTAKREIFLTTNPGENWH